jgi:hypothetical protein
MLCRQKSLAWHYLQLGNRIMAAHVQHDLRKEQRNLHNIKGIFRAPFVTSGVQDRSSIFIVGMPRSGSTLVEQMLASHSQVFVHSAQGGGGAGAMIDTAGAHRHCGCAALSKLRQDTGKASASRSLAGHCEDLLAALAVHLPVD